MSKITEINGRREPRAPAIAVKLEAARAMLAAHRGEMGQAVLDEAENVPGATKRLQAQADADMRPLASLIRRILHNATKPAPQTGAHA